MSKLERWSLKNRLNNSKNIQPIDIYNKKMNYKKHYDLLISTRLHRDWSKLPYTERHHIIPKSENGTDEQSNIVRLTAREHFLAHWLLYRSNPSIKSRAFSFWRMCNGRGSTPPEHWITISSRCYEESRLAHSKALSEALKGKKKSAEHARKVGLAVKGQKRTEQQKIKLRKPHIMTEDGLRRLRLSKQGKTPVNAKKVAMIDKETLRELKTFNSLKEAADFVRLHSSNIHQAIKNGSLAGNYRWKYQDQLVYKKNISIQEKLGKKIIQYSIDGILIKEWVSLSTAAKELNISSTGICNCCKNKTQSFKGFKWSYAD